MLPCSARFFLILVANLVLTPFYMVAQDLNQTPESNSSAEKSSIKPGRILGRVFDADSGEALKDVTVVLEDQDRETKTDLEGRYRLSEIAPGDYSLLFFKENYQRTRVKVEGVASGRSKLIDLPLNPDYSNLETLDAFEITAEDLAGSDIQLLALRQESMVVMDAMGSFDMSRLGAGNVADALTKMVGTSVQDGKYVVVRGLADRYSNATFNGVPIPSSDVYRNTPQLDLFPSIAVDSISIKKSMSPELGAAFAGGSVDVVTKAYPEEFTLNLSVGSKYHQMLFDEDRYLTYESDDQYGFGLDSRSLPKGFLESADFSSNDRNNPKVAEFMNGVNKDFTIKYAKPKLSQSYGLEFGNLIEKKDFSIGILASADFSQSYSAKTPIYNQDLTYLDSSDDFTISAGNSFQGVEGSEKNELGSYLQTSLIPNESNEIGLVNLWSHTGDKKAIMNLSLAVKGLNGEQAYDDSSEPKYIQRFEKSWVERDMLINQLYGKHLLEDFHDLEVNWRYAHTSVTLDEPETMRIQRGWRPDDDDYFGVPRIQSTQSITRVAPQQVWQNLSDESDFFRIDFDFPELPYSGDDKTIKFSFGISSDKLDRKFDESNFEVVGTADGTRDDNFAVPADWATFDAVAPGPEDFPSSGYDIHNYFTETNAFIAYKPTTRDYTGNLETDAYYLKSEISFPKEVRVSMGVRAEDFHAKTIPGIDPGIDITPTLKQNIDSTAAEIKDSSFYPSFAISKNFIHDLKFSLNYGRTTARPNLREIAHIESVDPLSNSIFKGNPFLKPSEISNYDARMDWSISETDLVSLSIFGKDIQKPIQAIRANEALNTAIRREGVGWGTDGNTNTFVNSESAIVYGFELEGKIGLETFSEYSKGLRIGGNLTWSSSEVTLSEPEKESIQYNKDKRTERSLEGQSEWIYTIDLSYANEDWGTSSTLVYSFYDSRLNSAFPDGPDDLWEDAYSTLDFIHSHKFGAEHDWKLKLSAKNLTAEDRIVRVNGYDAIEEKYGTSTTFGISLSKDF